MTDPRNKNVGRDMFRHFDTIQEREKQTEGRTDRRTSFESNAMLWIATGEQCLKCVCVFSKK